MLSVVPDGVADRPRPSRDRVIVRGAIAGVAAVLFGACAAAAPSVAPTSAPPVHWSYDGETGPDRWGDLDPTFRACAEGRAQSPIDLLPATEEIRPLLTFQYGRVEAQVTSGHTVQATVPAGSYMMVGDRRLDLLQFHFHSPSEHALDEERLAMEAHLVHRSAEGSIGVVGILMEVGRPNEVLDAVLASMPTEESEQASTATVDPTGLLPEERGAYHYSGSLTTPPCTEAVEWIVMEARVDVSETQLSTFGERFGENARPLQERHDRDVVRAPEEAP